MTPPCARRTASVTARLTKLTLETNDPIEEFVVLEEQLTRLEKLVAETPGYHVGPDGNVYSDDCPPETLNEIRERIVGEFYTPAQLLQIGAKALRNRLLRWRMPCTPMAGRPACGSWRYTEVSLTTVRSAVSKKVWTWWSEPPAACST